MVGGGVGAMVGQANSKGLVRGALKSKLMLLIKVWGLSRVYIWSRAEEFDESPPEITISWTNFASQFNENGWLIGVFDSYLFLCN